MDQDKQLLVLPVDPVVVEVEKMVQLDHLQIQQQILVPLNMVVLVVLVVLMVQVVVVLEPLDNHSHQPTKQDGVVQEYKHQLHSEILVRDMVDPSLEEIHQVKIGDLLVVVEVVVKQILLVLMVVLMFQVLQEEHQVDHTMVQEVVH